MSKQLSGWGHSARWAMTLSNCESNGRTAAAWGRPRKPPYDESKGGNNKARNAAWLAGYDEEMATKTQTEPTA